MFEVLQCKSWKQFFFSLTKFSQKIAGLVRVTDKLQNLSAVRLS